MGKVYVGNVKGAQGNSASIKAEENALGALVTATSGDGSVTTAQVYNGSAIRPDAGKFYSEDGNVPSFVTDQNNNCVANGFSQLITDITMESGIKQVGQSGFSCMYSLETIAFDDSDVPILGNYCFYGDSKLETATVHPFTIGSYCFGKCSSLTGIDLSKVTEIKSYAFSNCVSLEKLDFTNESPLTLTGDNIFEGVTCEIDFNKCTAINITGSPFIGAKCRKITVSEAWDSLPANMFYAGSSNTDGITEIDLKNITALGSNSLRNSYATVDLSKITKIGSCAICNVRYDGDLSSVKLFDTFSSSSISFNSALQVEMADLSSLEYLHSTSTDSSTTSNLIGLNATKVKLGPNFKGFDSSSYSTKAGKINWNAFCVYGRTQQVKVIVNSDTPIANVDTSNSYNVEVYVPDASYDDWLAVTNAYFSSHMHKLSELS